MISANAYPKIEQYKRTNYRPVTTFTAEIARARRLMDRLNFALLEVTNTRALFLDWDDPTLKELWEVVASYIDLNDALANGLNNWERGGPLE